MADRRIHFRDVSARRWRYQLLEPYAVHTDITGITGSVEGYTYLMEDGALTLRAGYAWDGATGIPDTPRVMRASVGHDALYQLFRARVLDWTRWRSHADDLFHRWCLEDGVAPLVADHLRLGLRLFAAPFARPRPPEDEERWAP